MRCHASLCGGDLCYVVNIKKNVTKDKKATHGNWSKIDKDSKVVDSIALTIW